MSLPAIRTYVFYVDYVRVYVVVVYSFVLYVRIVGESGLKVKKFFVLFSFFWTDWTSLEISPNQWKSLIYLGCIASGLGFFLWNKGATQTNHGILAAFNNAVVPLAVLCSLFIFGEARELNTDTLIRLSMGSFLIFSSILICKKNLWFRSKNQG